MHEGALTLDCVLFLFKTAMAEIWKDIEGYEDYKVSNLARVKSLKFGKERILKQGIDNHGYPVVTLCNGTQKNFKIHRMVAIAFIPNPCNKPEVNHKWGNKLDNRATELEWATKSENQLHAYKIGLIKPPMLGKFGKEHPKSRSISQYSLDGKYIDEYESQQEAYEKTGINNRDISLVCSGKLKTAGGYIWKFK